MEDWLTCSQSGILETERHWNDFPKDLLSLILSRLFFRDRCNFKLVCKSWNLICPAPPLLPPTIYSQEFDSPCLMISQRSNYFWKIFHSLCNDFYYLDFPELMDTEILYSKYGWLLMSKHEVMLFFFNPFTKEKIELPPTNTSFSSICFTSPPTSSSCVVFGILYTSSLSTIDFSFIKVGDEKWESHTSDLGSEHFWRSTCPPVFLNGVYYCLDCTFGNIMMFDLTKEKYELIKCKKQLEEEEEEDTEDADDDEEDENEDEEENEKEKEEEDDGDEDVENENKHRDEEEEDNEDQDYEEKDEDEDEEEEVEVRLPPIAHERYMVEVDGDIWGVFVTSNERRVSIQKLNLCEKRWIKFESLGNKCLYISKSGSFAKTCVVNGMANKIYFNKFHGKSGVMYSLTTRMYHAIEGGFASKKAYGLTEAEYGVWIKPTIDQM
ncbi:hypothetical protein CDL12_07531 [Handroanthus impetiginosus]|uniref:F-box domain-containing protein n=1 Tax=Handroanthus impetiginosus TaxID=429701 RepID=A0A2G9HR82_9LAMI|nr:hypothetical protein CDL12_07531 [Handroanthus impetiginosus]